MSYCDTVEEKKELVRVLYAFTEAVAAKAGSRGLLKKEMNLVLSPQEREEIDLRGRQIVDRLHNDFLSATKNPEIWADIAPDIVALTEEETQGFIRIFGIEEISSLMPMNARAEAFAFYNAPTLAGLCHS